MHYKAKIGDCVLAHKRDSKIAIQMKWFHIPKDAMQRAAKMEDTTFL
jgi:hypothetical protein